MDKNTLSNYGWIVIAVLVLSVMIALATPFGAFIEQGVRSTTEGLFDTSKNAVNTAFEDLGVQMDDQTFEEGYTGGQAGTQQTPTENLNHNTIIPSGGVYKVKNAFSGICEDCNADIRSGTPYYCYCKQYNKDMEIESCENCGYVFDNRTSCYCLKYTFDDIKDSEYIAGNNFPSNVDFGDTYEYGDYIYTYHCHGNENGSDCNNGTSCGFTHGWKVQVKDKTKQTYNNILETINNQPIVTLTDTFSNCHSLTVTPKIPETVVYMYTAFTNCESLKTVTNLPDGASMYGAFSDCTSLTDLPKTINNAGLIATFRGCTSLKKAPTLNNPKMIDSLFIGCVSLTGDVEINANDVITYTDCFKDTINEIKITGTLPDEQKQMLVNTANNHNLSY